MNIFSEKVDIQELQKYVDNKLITKRPHPEYNDVFIYNYADKAAYEKIWNEYTLQARGLIVDSEGNILGRPFPKFFNHNEIQDKLPWDLNFKVYPKFDGSLIIVSEGGKFVATRGSFESVQAIWAKEIIKEKGYIFDKNLTYLFELIHPLNRVVVDYGENTELILLAVIETKSARELDIKDLFGDEFEVAEIIEANINNEKDLLALEEANAEGFVVRFDNGLRIKIKFESYKRLHKLRSHLSTSTILENLKNGEDVLNNVPDEFYDFVKEQMMELNWIFVDIEETAIDVYNTVKNLPSRKEMAILMNNMKYETHIKSIVFSMLDGKNYSKSIWTYIEKNKELFTNLNFEW